MGKRALNETNRVLHFARNHFKEIYRTDAEKELISLIKKDNLEDLQENYESAENLTLQFYDDYTPLHLAVECNANKCLEYFVDLEVPLNMQTKAGKATALQLAVENNNQQAFSLLLENGASVNIKNSDGESLIFVAIKLGRKEMFSEILDHGADINALNKLQYTPLQVAILCHQSDFAKQLILKDANICLGAKNSFALAKEANEVAIALLLKNRNSELASGVSQSSTSELEQEFIELITNDLLNAIVNDDEEQFKELATCLQKKDALLDICLNYNAAKCAQVLVEAGANVNYQNDSNKKLSFLMIAIDHQLEKSFDFLIEQKADVELVDENGETAIFHALRSNNDSFIEQLFAAECKLDLENKNAETPILIAIREGNEAAVKIIQEKESGAIAKNAQLSLFAAIDSGNENIVDLVISQANPDVNSVNKDQFTAFQYAVMLNNYNIAQNLISKGCEITQGPHNSFVVAICSNEIALAHMIQKKDQTLSEKEQILSELEKNPEINDIFGQSLLDVINDNTEELKNVNKREVCIDSLLLIATMLNSLSSIQALLELGADIDYREDETRLSSLHIACSNKYFDAAKMLIKRKCNVNIADINAETPLFYSVRENDKELIQFLVEYYAKKFIKNKDGKTASDVAKELGFDDVAAFLNPHPELEVHEPGKEVKEPETKDQKTNPRKRPVIPILNIAPHPPVEKPAPVEPVDLDFLDPDDAEKLRELIQKGEDPNFARINDNNCTFLHLAAEKGAINCCKMLISLGANIDPCTFDMNETPLHYAIRAEKIEVVDYLLALGANVHIENKEGENALFFAIRTKNKEIFDKLLPLYTPEEINDYNHNYQSPLLITIQSHLIDFAKALIDRGAVVTIDALTMAKQVNETNLFTTMLRTNKDLISGTFDTLRLSSRRDAMPTPTPEIYNAIRTNNDRVLGRLLNAGEYDLNYEDPENGMPLFKAIEAGSLACVKLLVQNGADVNGWCREYPLFTALRLGRKDIADYLIEEGADLNAETQDGETAIFAAVRSKRPEIVKDIIDKGADVNQTNANNVSPLYIAAATKSPRVVKTLLSNGAKPNAVGLPPLKLSQSIHDSETSGILSNFGAKNKYVRSPRTSRQVRKYTILASPRIRSSRKEKHQDNRCVICQRTDNLLTLYPCGHKAVCKDCLDRFAAEHSQCPVCHSAFYATK